MENTPRPRRSDRYQAQTPPSAQAAQPVTQHPGAANAGLSAAIKFTESTALACAASHAAALRRARVVSAADRVLHAAAESASAAASLANAARSSGAGAVYGHESGVFAAAAAPHCPASDAIRRAASGGIRSGGIRPTESADPNRLPLWLTWTIVGLCIVLLGLLAAHYLMQAYLTTRAEEWETARQNTLSYYHIVEGESGNSITYQPLIERYAAEYNLRPAFVAAIIRNESSFRTDAESSVGARGLMQLMPDTAEWIAGKIGDSNYSFDHLYDAETNIRYGCWYLNYLSKLFRGDAVLVSSAYHAGQTTVTRWLSDKGISSDGVTIPVDKLPDGPTKQYAGE